jgi:transcriptional regulator with XRE-family HTH domain
MTDQPIPTPSTLGAYVRQARERAGLSLRNLEAIVGVSRQLLLRLEHDEVDNPSPTLLHQLAQALELDSDDLFAFVGYRPSEKLPSLTPYLRAKYRLSPAALTEASEALRNILDKYDRDHDAK